MADPFTYDDNNSDDYLWVLILGGIFCFLVAYGIGANDVANAFGSSVGSKALKIWQALIIAGIFEFLGALLLGKGVTKTIRKGIAEVEVFRRDPEVLMFGMLCVLAATGVWLLVASYLELPVSTTHSTVGGIIGMALAAYGNDAVVWYEKDTDAFPPFKGVTAIVVSWVLSPVFSGIFASILFLVTKYLVLIHENSFIRTWIFFPFLVFVTLGINSFFIIYKGAAGIDELKDLPTGEAFMWAAIVGVVGGIGAGALGWYYLKPKVEAMYAESADAEKGAKEGAEADPKAVEMTTTNGETTEAEAGVFKRAFASVKNYFERNQKAVHGVVDTDDTVHGIHESTRVYDDSTEEAFKYLQVFTAICDSFAHGANDVANSIGPFAAIYGVYKNNQVSKNSDVPRWILAYGGIGIVIGLATYGYNIIRAIGVKLTKITPSRGYAIELGAALVVVIGSRLEIPLSTTHCQVGATVGVGLADSQGVKGVNWSLFLKVIFGWIITLVVVGFSTALLFALGAYSPGLNEIGQRNSYENGLWVNSELMIMRLNETLDFNDTSAWTDAERNLNTTLFELRENTTTLFRTPFLKGANFVPQFETSLDTFAEGFNAALDVALRPELHTAAADENIPPKPFN